MDTIAIADLKVYAYHGVYEDEKKNGQYFYLDLEMKTERFAVHDRIGDTVHYGEVACAVEEFVRQSRFDLIESVAEGVADLILRRFAGVRSVSVTVKKPDAPIPLNFGNVWVKIQREWTECYLALGSNLGDKKAYLDAAIEGMKQNPAIRIKAVSSYYVTPPYGVVDQDDFLNACVKIETTLSPHCLLGVCRELEAAAHRVRTRRWGERTLDVDILTYGQAVIRQSELWIPHREMHKRAFVLEPLSEIGEEWIHPVIGKSVFEMREALREQK